MYHTSQGSQLHYTPSSPCINNVGSFNLMQHTEPGTNPEEGCQIHDERLHDKGTWLCDPYARQLGKGHIAAEQ